MEKVVEFGSSQFIYDAKTGLPLRWESRNGKEARFSFPEPFISLEVNGFNSANDAEQMTLVRDTSCLGHPSEMLFDEVKAISPHDKIITIRTLIADSWELTTVYHYTDPNLIIRLNVKSIDPNVTILRTIRLQLGMSGNGIDGWELLMPGHIPELTMPIDLHKKLDAYDDDAVFGSRQMNEPGNSSSIMGMHHSETNQGLLSWWISDTFPMRSRMIKKQGHLYRESIVYCPCEMRQGDTLSLGDLYIAGLQGKRQKVIEEAAVSFRTYERAESYINPEQEQLKICELHIGEKMGRKLFDHYGQIIEKLPYIKELGYNTIEVMPAFRFPSYSVYDYFNLDVTYGSESELKRLVQSAKELGLKVILDIVFHGPLEEEPKDWRMAPGTYRCDSPYLTGRTDWFSRHESGVFAKTYTRAFDLANPELQSHIADAITYYAKEVGVHGMRLDAQSWNFFPNWKPEDGRRPFESIYAGYRMMAPIRHAVSRHAPELFYYTEGLGPLMAKYHEYRYNYDFHWIYPALSAIQDERGMSRLFSDPGSENTLTWYDLSDWLEEHRLVVPRGISIVHQTDSHDSHEWGGFWQGQFNWEAFGSRLHRVHLAMALFMDGSFMSFYGAEQDNESYYRDILPLKDLPLFVKGTCSYTSVRTSDPKVFCITWQYDRVWAIIMGNLEEYEKRIELSGASVTMGPKKFDESINLRNLIQGEERPFHQADDRMELVIEAFGIVMLTNL